MSLPRQGNREGREDRNRQATEIRRFITEKVRNDDDDEPRGSLGNVDFDFC
jgi:hypothetical protein